MDPPKILSENQNPCDTRKPFLENKVLDKIYLGVASSLTNSSEVSSSLHLLQDQQGIFASRFLVSKSDKDLRMFRI